MNKITIDNNETITINEYKLRDVLGEMDDLALYNFNFDTEHFDEISDESRDKLRYLYQEHLNEREIYTVDNITEIIHESLKNYGVDSELIHLVEDWLLKKDEEEVLEVNGYCNGLDCVDMVDVIVSFLRSETEGVVLEY